MSMVCLFFTIMKISRTIHLCILPLMCLFLSISCSEKRAPVNIILETDIGNDIDDALALAILNRYVDEGKANCLMIGVNKTGLMPAEYVDILNTFYGHHDIPIGVALNGVQDDDSTNYTRIARLRDQDGQMIFRHSIGNYDSLPDAVRLYRKVLSSQEDNSVVIASVGFSTNLIQLLDSRPDSFSSLTGMELVSRKVKLLTIMGGSCDGSGNKEYNIVCDIPAAKRIFSEWPSEIVVSPWELGEYVKYPSRSIENDYNWVEYHPYAEAFKLYGNYPADRSSWDPTAVIYAVEGCGPWFTQSSRIDISILDDGRMIMKLNPEGKRSFISSNDYQCQMLVDYLIQLASQKPLSFK